MPLSASRMSGLVSVFVALAALAGCDDTRYGSNAIAIPSDQPEQELQDEPDFEEDLNNVVEPPDDTPDFECQSSGASDLPGVSLNFPDQDCVFTLEEAAAGLEIAYEVEIDEVIAKVTAEPQDAGGCSFTDETGLIFFEEVTGDGQQYCECDTGLCGIPPLTVDLKAGVYPKTFEWTGTNWLGPSDTGNPLGPPFPAGAYTLTISSMGTYGGEGFDDTFKVEGTYTIYLVP